MPNKPLHLFIQALQVLSGLTALFITGFTLHGVAQYLHGAAYLYLDQPYRHFVSQFGQVAIGLFCTLPTAAIAYVFARWLLGRKLSVRMGPTALTSAWIAVWCCCWLAMYIVFAGFDVSTWSAALMADPVLWCWTLSVGLALLLGAQGVKGAANQSFGRAAS